MTYPSAAMAASVAVQAAIRHGHEIGTTAIPIPFAESTVIGWNYPTRSSQPRSIPVHSVAAGTAPSLRCNPILDAH